MFGLASVFRHGEGLGLWKYMSLPNPEIYQQLKECRSLILGGWDPAYKHLLQKTSQRRMVWWASSLGEIWLEPIELSFLQQILVTPEVDQIIFGDPEAAQAFQTEKTIHLPYPIDLQRFQAYSPSSQKDGICIFGPSTLKKNVLNQLAAVALIQRDQPTTLHLNNPQTAKLADVLGVRYEYHGWLPDQEYYVLLAGMKVSLQCSVAESFNYQGIESALLGVVPVTSPTIRWNLPELTVQNVNSAQSIASIILEVLCLEEKHFKELSVRCSEQLRLLAEKNNAELRRGLHDLF
jgi:hypothetical protein